MVRRHEIRQAPTDISSTLGQFSATIPIKQDRYSSRNQCEVHQLSLSEKSRNYIRKLEETAWPYKRVMTLDFGVIRCEYAMHHVNMSESVHPSSKFTSEPGRLERHEKTSRDQKEGFRSRTTQFDTTRKNVLYGHSNVLIRLNRYDVQPLGMLTAADNQINQLPTHNRH